MQMLPSAVGQEIWLALQKFGQGVLEHQLLPSPL